MKYSSMATRVCVAAITLFSTTLCSAEAGSDPKAQVADALIKAEADAEVAAVAEASKPAGKCLRLEFSVAPQAAGGPLASTGLLIVNPPWTLAGELKTILPELEKPLGQGGAGRFRLETPKP